MVIVEDPVPVIEVGLKETVTPEGWPEADNVTAELKPPVVVLVMVEVPDAPCATVTELGEAERLKPPNRPEQAHRSKLPAGCRYRWSDHIQPRFPCCCRRW